MSDNDFINEVMDGLKDEAIPSAHQLPNGLPDSSLSIGQSSQRKVIDFTSHDDDEVILISSQMLSDIACDINGAAHTLNDVSQLLALIHYGKIDTRAAAMMARLAHVSADTWVSFLYEQLEVINKPLALTAYGKGE